MLVASVNRPESLNCQRFHPKSATDECVLAEKTRKRCHKPRVDDRVGSAIAPAMEGGLRKFLDIRKPPMKLFSVTFALSAFVTLTAGICYAQDPGRSGSAPMPRARFEKSPAQNYLMMRARQDSENRYAVIRQYEAAGFNFGQPEINGNFFYSAVTPRTRRFVAVQTYTVIPGNEYGY
jgi:hypothetical protein